MTIDLISISVGIWMCMLALSKPEVIFHRPSYGKCKSKNYNVFFVLFFLFCVFAFSEYDLYHMWKDFLEMKISENLTYYEPIYRWLAGLVGMKYFFWRSIVWGIAVVCIYYLSSLLNDKSIAMMFSITLLLPMSYFVATRGSAAHGMALLGISLLIGCRGLFRRKLILSGTLLILSVFLHRSNLLFIGILIISLFIPLNNKKIVITSLIIYPILVLIITNILNSFTSGGFELAFGDGMNIQDRAMRFASGDKNMLNSNGLLGVIINRGSLVLITIYLTKKIIFQGVKLPKIYYFYYKATYLYVYVSLLFVSSQASLWMFERLMFMSLFPMCFIFSKVLQLEKKNNKLFKYVLLYALITIAYSISYKYYKLLR